MTTTTQKTDMTVANTILAQLGDRRFIAMTGAKNMVGGDDYLMFSIGRNSTRTNKVRITLTARDDYTVELMFQAGLARNFETRVLETVEGVHADNLCAVFTAKTGLLTSL